MPITDLTGYTWVGNDNLTEDINTSFYISFISNNENFDYLTNDESPFETLLMYITVPSPSPRAIIVYDFDTNQWTNDAYKTIQFTGGTDATNATLIAWLEANGTLTAPQPQPTGTNKVSIGTLKLAKASVGNSEIVSMWLGNVKIYEKGSSSWGGTDLTGTTWEIENITNEDDFYNSFSDFPFNDPSTCYINFVSNNTHYTDIMRYRHDLRYNVDSVCNEAQGWVNQAYRTINITGGTDATNTYFINWLQNHATLISW